jgi:2-polyprenyl-3-methyl-5-hydroxy-6-metoxy-1,4-benzoquinol methylase
VSRYAAEFDETGAHGHSRDLLARAGLDGGVVLDLGCAAGTLAEPVTDLGFDYVGADFDRMALDELAARGFEAHPIDLRADDDGLDAALAAIVGDRRVVAVLLLDVIEHLVDPGPTLRAVARLGDADHRPLLVISVPNVSHVDIAAKLLAGRWDMTETGLLDDTHVRFFNEARVTATLAASGWREVDAFDVVNPFSDQQFPADAPVLRQGVPLRQLLQRIRRNADAYGETYQFVRSFEHSMAAPVEEAAAPAGDEATGPFLSVVLRVSGPGEGAAATLRDLAAQTLPDFEVLVTYDDGVDGADQAIAPDGLDGTLRVLKPEPDWRNGALAEAAGRYVVFLDDRTRVGPGYVQTVHRLAGEAPARVVQLGAHLIEHPAPDDPGRAYAELVEGLPSVDLDPLDIVNMRPFGAVVLAAHAVPREAFATAGVRFGAEPRRETDAAFLFRCVELCGIARTDDPVAAVEPRALRNVADDLHYLAETLGEEPLVLPPGAASFVLHLRAILAAVVPERDDLAARLEAANDEIAALSELVAARQDELAGVTTEVVALEAASPWRIFRGMRRRLGRLVRRV